MSSSFRRRDYTRATPLAVNGTDPEEGDKTEGEEDKDKTE